MSNPHSFSGAGLIALAVAFGAAASVTGAAYADALLTGAITSAAGEKVSGVTTSARAEGSPITTSVFTDEAGNYYFPLLPDGKYRVWAQALTYQTARGDVELRRSTTRRDFVLRPMKDRERGIAIGSHGITRDENGILWFNTRSHVERIHGGLGRVDPRTEKITVYLPPKPMSGTSGTLDADMNGNVWVTSPDGALRFNILTKETTLIPLPNPEAHQPYQIGVDKAHNVWTNLWSTDKVAKYDPATGQWTLFELPTRGTEARHISLLEREGQPLRVIVPYDRARKVAVLTPRTEAELGR